MESAKRSYYRVCWLPLAMIILARVLLTVAIGASPWWGEGLIAILGTAVLFFSVVLFVYGLCLVVRYYRQHDPLAGLLVATLVSGSPLLIPLVLIWLDQ